MTATKLAMKTTIATSVGGDTKTQPTNQLTDLFASNWDADYKEAYLDSSKDLMMASHNRSRTTSPPSYENVYYDSSGRFHDHPIYQRAPSTPSMMTAALSASASPASTSVHVWLSGLSDASPNESQLLEDALSWFIEQHFEQSRSRHAAVFLDEDGEDVGHGGGSGSDHRYVPEDNRQAIEPSLQRSLNEIAAMERNQKWVEQLESIPRSSWNKCLKTEEEVDSNTKQRKTYPICPICSKRDLHIVRKMQCCNQAICQECLLHWLTTKPTCCFCRRPCF